MFKGSSDKKISCISEIIVQYHAAWRITETLYSTIRGDLKMITGFLYVVSIRLLAKLWDNEFSRNHDRTFLLQVMVGFFFCFFFVVQDHNQGPCATWDICQKPISNSNHARSRFPHICSIVLKCCNVTLHSGDTDMVCAKYQKHVYTERDVIDLRDFARFEIEINFGLHWTAPLEPDFFSYTVSRVSNLVWLRFVLVECFFYHYCSRIWSPAQFFRYIDGQYYLYQYYLYNNDCTVTYIHALHTPMGSRFVPRTASSVNEIIYLPKHSWSFYHWKFNLTSVMWF